MAREAHDDWAFKGTVTVGTGTLVDIFAGTGSPEGVVTAGIGSLFMRTDGTFGTVLYVKESGAGNTGWIAYNAIGPPGLDGVEATFTVILSGNTLG